MTDERQPMRFAFRNVVLSLEDIEEKLAVVGLHVCPASVDVRGSVRMLQALGYTVIPPGRVRAVIENAMKDSECYVVTAAEKAVLNALTALQLAKRGERVVAVGEHCLEQVDAVLRREFDRREAYFHAFLDRHTLDDTETNDP